MSAFIDPRIDVAIAQDLSLDWDEIRAEENELTEESMRLLRDIALDIEIVLDEIGISADSGEIDSELSELFAPLSESDFYGLLPE